MSETTNVEKLLGDAIALLEESGFPMAADALRDSLNAIRRAPTEAARRRRAVSVRELLEVAGHTEFYEATPVGPDVLRHRRVAGRRGSEQRYRETLEAIQGLLSPPGTDEDWSPSFRRIA
ncbi:MAG TPA: hypothetical protein VFV19_09410 [Candidatus Polarisedimenticolaceae bacterium]|nr:hypothetical protein [Candidatus Polarisedimenticolaceae bacterium]